jgi:hypothetical protein
VDGDCELYFAYAHLRFAMVKKIFSDFLLLRLPALLIFETGALCT